MRVRLQFAKTAGGSRFRASVPAPLHHPTAHVPATLAVEAADLRKHGDCTGLYQAID